MPSRVTLKCKLGVDRCCNPLFHPWQGIVIRSGWFPPPMSPPLPLAGGSCESKGLAAPTAEGCLHGAQRRPESQVPSHSASFRCLCHAALVTWPPRLQVRQWHQLTACPLATKCCAHHATLALWPCYLHVTKGSQLIVYPLLFPVSGGTLFV